ncbi:hypothetical protein [Saccharopolyspora gloriosae]|uniref:hypothetical protein n=1 Tax=Saccharopolyspora gloriosae TaxID=455344 RepID=UPI001FB69981|nr:hypothetical protein [Saccharopolyspora gloriosae]
MRPSGVRRRIEELRRRTDQRESERPDLALGRALAWFVHGCASLGYVDVSTSAVIETYRTVLAQLDDPAQRRTGSRWEQTVLRCVELLREPMADRAADPYRHAGRDDAVTSVLVKVPMEVLVGRSSWDAIFPMACRNAAGGLLDGVIAPYRAVGFIVSIGYWEPPLERGLLADMRDLRVRYEDEPDARSILEVEIVDRLRAWLADRGE